MLQHPPRLIACHECDLLQREVAVPPKQAARCRRCGAVLYRNSPDSIDRTLAFTLAAAILFAVANTFPIIGIELKGNRNAMNLYESVHSLWGQGMRSISSVVFITTILVPALELGMMVYLLLPLKLHSRPRGLTLILRLLQGIKPWGMVEVFMLGILVALVKLTQDFIVIPGVALWSFGALTLLLAAAAASFNPRDVWARLEREQGEGKA